MYLLLSFYYEVLKWLRNMYIFQQRTVFYYLWKP